MTTKLIHALAWLEKRGIAVKEISKTRTPVITINSTHPDLSRRAIEIREKTPSGMSSLYVARVQGCRIQWRNKEEVTQ